MKGKLILFSVILIAVLIGGSYLVLNFKVSKGVRSGRLVKLSKKGVLLKTYEGTLDLGSGDKLTWDFSIHDDKVGKELVRHSGKVVQLEYGELLFKIFYGTKYNVFSFKILDKNPDPMKYLCRLVNLLRKNHEIVNAVRQLINSNDPNFLNIIRECQK